MAVFSFGKEPTRPDEAVHIAGHGHTLLVEMKAPKGHESVDQEVFRMAWAENGGRSLIWRSDADAWALMREARVLGPRPT